MGKVHSPLRAGEKLSKVDAFLSYPLELVRLQMKALLATLGRRPGDWYPLPCPNDWILGKNILGTFSSRHEWDEPAKMPDLSAGEWQWAYPSLEAGKLTFRKCHFEDLVLSPRWKVLEAPSHAPIVKPQAIFVPCLLADLKGRRIGRGGGFYDRYINENPEVHSDFVVSEFPNQWLHEGDQPLGGLITESFTASFQTKETST